MPGTTKEKLPNLVTFALKEVQIMIALSKRGLDHLRGEFQLESVLLGN